MVLQEIHYKYRFSFHSAYAIINFMKIENSVGKVIPMRKNHMSIKKVFIFSLLLFLLLPVLLPLEAEAADQKTVLKVAFPQLKGFSETDENGRRYGSVVDFLTEIAKYTNWEYEYVDVSSDNIIDEFDKGNFDLMGGVYYISDFEEKYGYPEYNCGYAKSLLLAREDDSSLKSYNLSSLNGKKIGVYERATENIRILEQYLDAHSLDCELVYYTYEDLSKNSNELYHFLDTHEVDMILDKNMKDSTVPCRIITMFDTQPMYLVTTPGNQDVIDGLNMALESIYESNPSFATEVYYRNFPFTASNDIILSADDLQYINEKKDVSVAVVDDWHPLFCLNSSDAHDGLLPDILEEISKYTGLHFNYIYYDQYMEAVQAVKQGDADILGFFLGTEEDAKAMDMVLLQEYGTMENILVRNKSATYPSADLTAAALEGRPVPKDVPLSNVTYYPSTLDAIAAVNRGDADIVYGLSSHLERDMQEHFYPNLVPMNLSNDYSNLCLAMSKPADPRLMRVLNKAINQMPDKEKTDIVNQNLISIGTRKISFLELVYGNPLLSVAVMVILLLSVITVISFIARSRIRAAVIQGDLERAQADSQAKGEFLSRMSHEIRTPMNAVVGLADLTCMIEDLPQEVRDNLTKIRSSSRYLLSLINNILDMSRIDNGKMTIAEDEPFSLASMLEEIHDMMAGEAARRKLNFMFEKDLKHETFAGDEIRLKQVLMNLMSNALKFTPEGGRIILETKETESSPSDASLTFRVIDTGSGIPKADQERIFKAFEQVGSNLSKSQGTGLGLPISSSIVQMMGGTLHLKSEEGAGSEFYFTIRLRYADLKKEPPQRAAADSPDLLKGMHILLAEDNDLNAKIAISLLEKRGAVTDRAEDGQKAVELFERSAKGSYQVILMDVQMPVLNGLEATRKIRSLAHPDASTIPIYAVSASSFQEDKAAAMNAGMTGFVAKPIDINELYQILSNILCS